MMRESPLASSSVSSASNPMRPRLSSTARTIARPSGTASQSRPGVIRPMTASIGDGADRGPSRQPGAPSSPTPWESRGPVVRQRVGPTIKSLRQRQGHSLHALARTAEISPSHLSRIERGLTVPSYDVLDRIADALGSDLRQLRNEEERARAIDHELDQLFDRLELPSSTRSELLHLSHRARADLARAIIRAARRSA